MQIAARGNKTPRRGDLFALPAARIAIGTNYGYTESERFPPASVFLALMRTVGRTGGPKNSDMLEKEGKTMDNQKMLEYILDSYPYKVVFVDCDHVIRYMNKAAKYHYYEVRGYRDLIGKSIFDCHNAHSKQMILEAVEKLKNHGSEKFLGVTPDNQRFYLNPVRDENGELVGYFERFELNLQK